jgi:hypothetical protein
MARFWNTFGFLLLLQCHQPKSYVRPIETTANYIDSDTLLENVLAFLEDPGRDIFLIFKFDKVEQPKKMILEPWNKGNIE